MAMKIELLTGGVVGLGCRFSEAVHPDAEVDRRPDGVWDRDLLDFAISDDHLAVSSDDMSVWLPRVARVGERAHAIPPLIP